MFVQADGRKFCPIIKTQNQTNQRNGKFGAVCKL